MKKILVILSFIAAVAGTSCAQQPATPNTNTADGLKKYVASIQHIAPYRILTTDSAFVTPADLKKGKPTVVIYFSPDCSHCQRMMYEFKPKMSTFKDVQVVMVTWSLNYDLRGIREFRRDYDLAKYHNFVIGTEGYTRKVQMYYNITSTPFIAIYDKNGKLSKYFDKVTPPDTILAAVKKV